jgi:hypothetical protein
MGGGCDLTPNYLTYHPPALVGSCPGCPSLHESEARAESPIDLRQDIRDYHAFWKGICDEHSTHLYPEYKLWCDRCAFNLTLPEPQRQSQLPKAPAAVFLAMLHGRRLLQPRASAHLITAITVWVCLWFASSKCRSGPEAAYLFQ